VANGRRGKSKIDAGRDPGRFITLPMSVLTSPAYLHLSDNARALMLELAVQCIGDDNGRLLLSRAHLRKRGWLSASMIDKGRRELLDTELIFETVRGCRPNKASWYAVTWRRLDKHPGFDLGVEVAFERSAYLRWTPPKNAVLSPRGGTESHRIGPQEGPETPSPSPQGGSIRAVSGTSPSPPQGHPLDIPSARCRLMAVMSARTQRAFLQPNKKPPGYTAARNRISAQIKTGTLQ
jgi:hypothetical protein